MQVTISKNEQQLGPFDLDGLRDGIGRGLFTPDDFAWQDGCTDWVRLRELVSIADLSAPGSLSGAVAEQSARVESALSRLVSDEQDPAVVQKLFSRVQELLTKDECIEYIGVQKKPIVTFSPDAVVLTNRRFMVVRPKLMGMTFEDYPWREVADVHMSEQLLGATITCTTVSGCTSMIDSIPKKQARRIYSYAQEVEERAHFARRDAELERLRASAGGVVVHTPASAPPPLAQSAPQQDDPVAVLSKLKKMLESGLIEQAEFDAKKTEILSRM